MTTKQNAGPIAEYDEPKQRKHSQNKYTFRYYIVDKTEKLKNQFLEQVNNGTAETSKIFEGISIWVNGYTQPSSMQLKAMIGQNGGLYQHYYHKSEVTHIIATNLTDAKIKQLTSTDKIVHPNWILDSIEAGKLLPYQNYSLYTQQKNNTNNTIIKSFGTTKEKDKEILPQKSNISTSSQFVGEFYRSSRLHFLSTWRLQFQQQITEYLQSLPPNPELVDEEGLHSHRIIMHVDMDSFFVSVAVLSNPALANQPVVVCHSNAEGSAEAASVSYEARKFGVRNGMFMKKVKRLCPDVIVVPYQFDLYEKVSKRMYEVLVKYTNQIQAVSCDEALLDMSWTSDPLQTANQIRNDIFESTGCTASVGIGENILLSKLACRKAKPNGTYWLKKEEISYIHQLPVRDLPSVGWKLEDKLADKDIHTCADLLVYSKAQLQTMFGNKVGETLYNFARGEDDRPLKLFQQRQSVGADVNWGIRFETNDQALAFLKKFSEEVSKRLRDSKAKGRTITLKLRKRREGAPEPVKYLGCGISDAYSRSVSLVDPTDDGNVIYRECVKLHALLAIEPEDMRGVGIHLTKLVFSDQANANTKSSIVSYFKQKEDGIKPVPTTADVSANNGEIGDKEEEEEIPEEEGKEVQGSNIVALPPWSQVDPTVMDALPLPLKRELEIAYFANTSTKKPRIKEKKRKKGPVHETPKKPKTLPEFEKIDPSVMAALPQDIQDEIMRELGMKQPVQPQRQQELQKSDPQQIQEPQKQEQTQWQSLETNASFQHMQQLLSSKFQTGATPDDTTVDKTVQCLHGWIRGKDLEHVNRLLSALRFWGEQEKSWQTIFNTCLKEANMTMTKQYRGILSFDPF